MNRSRAMSRPNSANVFGGSATPSGLCSCSRRSAALYQPSEGMTDCGPLARRYGCDATDLGEELAPGVLTRFEDGRVALEHAVGKIGLAQILPDVFCCVEFRTCWRQWHQRKVVREFELARGVPAGLVEND